MKTNAIISIGTMLLPIAIFLMTLAIVIEPYAGFPHLVLKPLFWCGVASAVFGFIALRWGFSRASTDDANNQRQHNELHGDLQSLNRNLSNFVNEIRQERNERTNKPKP